LAKILEIQAFLNRTTYTLFFTGTDQITVMAYNEKNPQPKLEIAIKVHLHVNNYYRVASDYPGAIQKLFGRK